MIGIVLLSHGKMAEGMLDTCGVVWPQELPQIKAVCFQNGDTLEGLDEQIESALLEVDDGHGVLGLCDLQGGTPYNRCVLKANDRFQVVAGMNFPILLEVIQERMMGIDISELNITDLMAQGKEAISSLNELMAALQNKQ